MKLTVDVSPEEIARAYNETKDQTDWKNPFRFDIALKNLKWLPLYVWQEDQWVEVGTGAFGPDWIGLGVRGHMDGTWTSYNVLLSTYEGDAWGKTACGEIMFQMRGGEKQKGSPFWVYNVSVDEYLERFLKEHPLPPPPPTYK